MNGKAKFSWTDSAYASIWLVFLLFPIISLAVDDMPNPARTFGFVFLAMFVLMYPVANGYLSSWPEGAVGWRVAFWWALLCVPIVGFSIFVSPLYSYVFFPYMFAVVVFTLRGSVRVWLASILVVACALLALLFAPNKAVLVIWLGHAILSPILMLPIALVSEKVERQDALAAEIAIAHEREEIASDLHDLLGQTLTLLSLKADVASKLAERQPENVAAIKESLDEIAGLSRVALAEVRAAVTRTRIPDFAGEMHAARRALETAGITVQSPAPQESGRIAGVNSYLFGWVLREAVTNVVRHSGASSCLINVTPTSITISDNGRGFDQDGAAGSGLVSMKRRVEEAGGSVTITGDNGTTVAVRMAGRS
ncbi:sensor histidine kinase [uncultured Actinomyces sp.]|uniref:sensor histidine kinase n=1 Tax=uncultured Actinomyces sp. TaxID=249061 RepID=UPI002609B069|nr:sensor histidine kinase [uncultured Actinomyces sp.]